MKECLKKKETGKFEGRRKQRNREKTGIPFTPLSQLIYLEISLTLTSVFHMKAPI